MVNRIRGFEVVSYAKGSTDLPYRADIGSAGYDFISKETVEILPNHQHLFWTDIKVYMEMDEVLEIYPRSSLGVKHGLTLANTVGVVDSTYYNNLSNEGNIGICLRNNSHTPVLIAKGDRIAQGVFKKYLTVDNEVVNGNERVGGFGSSGK